MLKLKFVKILAFFVALAGLLVAIGWIFDIGFLRNIPPSAVPMKFTTAVCFVAGSIVLYSATHERSESSFTAQTILPSAILLILLVMVTLLVSSIFGFHSDLDPYWRRVFSRSHHQPAVFVLSSFNFRYKHGHGSFVRHIVYFSRHWFYLMWKYGLKTKLVASFALMSLVAIVVAGASTLISMRRIAEQEIQNKLLLLAEAKEGQIFAYLDSLESRTLDFSSDGFIRDSLKKINEGNPQATEALNEHLTKNKKKLDPHLLGVFVM